MMTTTVRPLEAGRGGSVEADSALRFVLQFDDTDSPADVVDALALTAFVHGGQPWSRSTRLDRVRDDADLLPPGATVLRTAESDHVHARLACGDGWTLRAVRWTKDGGAEVTVTAVSEQLAASVLADAVRDAEEPAPVDDSVSMGFWYRSPRRGVIRNARTIGAEGWPGIRGNYASEVAGVLDNLMAITPDRVAGRLLLLHGPPGTGKTTVLRSLAREWRDWCQVDCVLDPEYLFADLSYLMDVAMGADTGTERRWRLLILEDCDELIRGEAKAAAGQALARLLNLTDGLLGQGRDVLVAITTNEPLSRLHPAIVRPGRCLAQIEVGPLPPEEAVAWLGNRATVGARGATLAELYALRDGTERLTRTEPDDLAGYL